MKEIIKKLDELLSRLERAPTWDMETLIDCRNKLNLYLSKFFKNKDDYELVLSEINIDPQSDSEYTDSITKMKSLITTLVEDINISESNISIMTEKERSKILEQTRIETEQQREKIELEASEIRKLKEQLHYERERLVGEEEKFNEFKAKLEIADKKLDFQSQAAINKKNANFWALGAAILIAFLIFVLFKSLDTYNSFSKIAQNVKADMNITNPIDSLTSTTIYFTYSKFLFTKILLYSLLIYAIIFFIKNYNAQMHNHVINTHKANAFKSTLSLLNTARSEDGNDKLLIQATQAIFSHQQTGYNGKESEPPSPNMVTNLIDATAKKIS